MDFFPADLLKYSEDHSQPESELLKQVNRETHLHTLKPRMLSGHLQGRVLSFLSKLQRPKYILEIGTYTGYAALCLAEGLQDGGILLTLDKNPETTSRAEKYFHSSAFQDQIEVRVGNAIEILPSLHYEWDLVFIDADKENYGVYFDLIVEQTRSGGLIIADNVLWSGKIADPEVQDRATISMRKFNKKIQKDRRVENVLLPIRDGLLVMRKT
ncbi:MAG: O-methyltransferase [Bacteroidota bacterium]